MATLDILLLLVGLLMVVFSAAVRTVKALFMMVGVYFATLTGALLYQELAFRLKLFGNEEIWFEGLVFIALFFLLLFIFFLILRAAFPDSSLPKIGFLDVLFGGLVGVVVALLTMTMVYQGVKVMVSDSWEPFTRYASIQGQYFGSRLGPWLKQVLSLYLYAFYPFFVGTGFPPVLIP
ncbi:MAG: CvpA family protein [Anaerolineales bacterium]